MTDLAAIAESARTAVQRSTLAEMAEHIKAEFFRIAGHDDGDIAGGESYRRAEAWLISTITYVYPTADAYKVFEMILNGADTVADAVDMVRRDAAYAAGYERGMQTGQIDPTPMKSPGELADFDPALEALIKASAYAAYPNHPRAEAAYVDGYKAGHDEGSLIGHDRRARPHLYTS